MRKGNVQVSIYKRTDHFKEGSWTTVGVVTRTQTGVCLCRGDEGRGPEGTEMEPAYDTSSVIIYEGQQKEGGVLNGSKVHLLSGVRALLAW